VGLQIYRRKRKFDVTSEPSGRTARTRGDRFVIQKHAARRLHYDLRLELDGVMKSWAVTRGPSLVPGEKRLAVHVEDHPIEYNTFEGTIPQGEYGGGTVLLWDRGHWHPEGDPHRGLRKGNLTFTLDGEKLHGTWHLVRMRGRPGESKENWLLIKAHDQWERSERDPDVLEEMPNSVVTGRSIPEIAEGKGKKRVWHSNRNVKANIRAGATLGAAASKPRSGRATRRTTAAAGNGANTKKSKSRAKAKKSAGSPLPDFVPPSLATLRATAPSGPGWVHEIKFDGYRIQAHLDRGDVRLLTRKGLDWTERFAAVARAISGLPAETALLDGEIVVEDEHGASNFALLQDTLKSGAQDRFVYYLFDLLYLDGDDLRDLPLVERKARLKQLLAEADAIDRKTIRYSEHFDEDGPVVWQHACDMRLEGIVSKRADAPYRPGRSEEFIKTKCADAQEFVVGGYSPSTALANAIGALAVGYYDGGRLVYAGRIGTGYTQATARALWKRLHAIERERPPFDVIPAAERRRRDVRWVEPKLVIESHFRGWTGDQLVRQAAFKGLREDKPPTEVVREVARAVDNPPSTGNNASPAPRVAAEALKSMTRKSDRPTKRPRSARARGSPDRGRAAAKGKSSRRAGSSLEADVRLTHPDRVYWVDVGVTKQDLADYYRDVWHFMAPHVVGRPLALVRCPEGTKGECFFQKHAAAGLTPALLHAVIDSKGREVIAVEDLDGMMSLVQAGVLEVHVRGSRIDRLDHCDRIVFDLDPGEGLRWADIVAAAREVRERLQALDLESFVKLSGGKGLHVLVPIEAADWNTVKSFVQAFAQAMAADHPDRYIAKMTKAARGGKIFVDYLRNSLEQTAVAAYSTRARAGAPVSVPVSWQELGRSKGSNQYTVRNLSQRLSALKQDPWRDVNRVRQRLPDLKTLRKRG
jgi:bifunctional non-homologous end joining protein LigD